MTFQAIIPARYASTRFPGKPLALLGGKTVIERVWRRVSEVVDDVIVATDDTRIADAVAHFGGRAVMTATTHRSGTDRCQEAHALSGSTADVVINVQGDEPFIHPDQLRALMACFDQPTTDIATLVKPFDPARGYEALLNPNVVKVVIGNKGQALFFSRQVIPHVRGKSPEQWPDTLQYYTHIGLYAYRTAVLQQITSLAPGTLEQAESLEQLRWLENGFVINTGVSTHDTIGIDTPDDLARAEAHLQSQQSS